MWFAIQSDVVYVCYQLDYKYKQWFRQDVSESDKYFQYRLSNRHMRCEKALQAACVYETKPTTLLWASAQHGKAEVGLKIDDHFHRFFFRRMFEHVIGFFHFFKFEIMGCQFFHW